MLFNILISVYLAIFLGPAIVDMFPAAGGSAFSNALAMASTGVGAFLILHCISYTFITGQFTVSLPRILDSLGAALLGFLAGFLVWSFASLLICTSPISQNAFIELNNQAITIVQFKNYRIVITKPPFADGWELTAVRPLVSLA